MKKLILFGLLSFWINHSFSQEWIWSEQLECAGNVNITSILNDDNGNTYLGGIYIGADLTIAGNTVTNSGLGDGFVCMFDQNGTLQWLENLSGTGDDEVVSLQLIGTNLYVLGNTKSAPCNIGAYSVSSANNWDSFWAIYRVSDGVAQSAQLIFTGSNVQRVKDFVYNPYQNIFAGVAQFQIGITYDTVGGSASGLSVASSSGKDMFTFTLNLSAQVIDYVVYTTTVKNGAILKFIELAQDNGYYIGGDLTGTFKFTSTDSLNSYDPASTDVLIVSVDNNLDFNWATRGGGAGSDNVNALIADEDGFVYSSGKIESTAYFLEDLADSVEAVNSNQNAALADMYLVKYNQSGTLQWLNRLGAEGQDNASGLAIQEDLVQYCGNFADTIIINNDTLVASVDDTINTSFAIFDRAGSPISAQSIGGVEEELGQEIGFNKVTGYTIIAGQFVSPTMLIGSSTLTNASDGTTGTKDGFIAAYSYPFNATFASFTDSVNCNGSSNGMLLAKTFYGVGPYTYDWSASTGSGDFNDSIATNLSAGYYELTITDSRTETTTINYTIKEPDVIEITLDSTNVSCNLYTDGTIITTVSGGNGEYNYTWSGPSVSSPGSKNQSNLGPGKYILTVTDLKGCTANDSTYIIEPDPIYFGDVVVVREDPVGSSTGSISLDVSGGTQPYNYSWDLESIAMTGRTYDTLNNISEGEYTAHISDNNSCQADTNIIVPGEIFRVLLSGNNISCYNSDDGQAFAQIVSGDKGFVYLFEFEDASSNSITPIDDTIIVNLVPGWYYVTATEQGGDNRVAFDSVEITQPDSLALTLVPSHVSCYNGTNGSIALSITGGTAPRTVSWSNDAVTQSISNLNAGWYTATVTDAKGCKTIDSTEVTQPDSMTISIVKIQDVLCYDGKSGRLQASVSGGTPGYTYLWNNSGATTSSLVTNLSTGIYTVRVTDSKTCIQYAKDTIFQPSLFELVELDTSNIVCYGQTNGKFIVDMQGGTLPYHFSWLHSTLDTNQFISLYPGDYQVTVKDDNNCAGGTYNFTVKAPGTELSLIEVSASHQNVLCNGDSNGELEVLAAYGWGSYKYSADGSTWEDNPVFTGLPAKPYTISVKDAGGCIVNTTVEITEPEIFELVSIDTANVVCFGANDGVFGVNMQGGIEPYDFTWSHSDTNVSRIEILAPDYYEVTVVDANNCAGGTFTYTVVEPSVSLSISEVAASHANINCKGDNNGVIEVSAAGGWGNYEYSNNGSAWGSTLLFSDLEPANYTISVRDSLGCVVSTSQINISEPSSQLSLIALGIGNQISATGNGGTPPLSFSLDNSTWQATGTFSNLSGGNYTVYLKDANNCGPIESQNIEIATAVDFTTFNTLSVYPNPSDGLFKLEMDFEDESELNIEVYSIVGVKVYSDHRVISSGKNQVVNIDLTGTEQGVYLLQINGVMLNTKLIVE
ncbi:MAG: T9SS type A sorting domain-containing protein [Bacteroidales bacterium]|nr:T9SS type A sorting domain-containing protein [Bacteroidales bacterium]MBN2817831.1 T9SS type A sorting domain-containing protein [Bacteroidales bacterium]